MGPATGWKLTMLSGAVVKTVMILGSRARPKKTSWRRWPVLLLLLLLFPIPIPIPINVRPHPPIRSSWAKADLHQPPTRVTAAVAGRGRIRVGIRAAES